MSIKDATPDEIAAMRQRLRDRQEARSFDQQTDEAIAIVRSRRLCSTQPRGQASNEAAMVQHVSFGRAVLCGVNAILRNWLFLLVLGMSVFAAAAIAG